MGNWKDIRARHNGKCKKCKKPIMKGDRIFWLPGDHSVSGFSVTLCQSCFKITSLGVYEKTSTEVPPVAKETTLKDIVRGVRSNYPEEPKENDALDVIMDEAFEDHKKRSDPHEKEAEKYSLAWFAVGAKWQLG